jgi:hypothetical protein
LVFLTCLCAWGQQLPDWPVCKLPGPNPVKLGRQLGPGETWAQTDRNYPVKLLNSKNKTGHCILQAPAWVAVNAQGIMLWARDCGNNEMTGTLQVAPPVKTVEGPAGPAGATGAQGLQGERGPAGATGATSSLDRLEVSPLSQTVKMDYVANFTATFVSGTNRVDVTRDSEWLAGDSRIGCIQSFPGQIKGCKPGSTLVNATYRSLLGTGTLAVRGRGFCHSTLCRVGFVAGGAAAVIIGCRLGHCGGWGSPDRQVFFPPATIAK